MTSVHVQDMANFECVEFVGRMEERKEEYLLHQLVEQIAKQISDSATTDVLCTKWFDLEI